MPSIAEEQPDYAEKVTAYLAKHGMRRLPWSAVLSHGQLTYSSTAKDRQARGEMGETAIALLSSLGVSEDHLRELTDLGPLSPDALLARFRDMVEPSA